MSCLSKLDLSTAEPVGALTLGQTIGNLADTQAQQVTRGYQFEDPTIALNFGATGAVTASDAWAAEIGPISAPSVPSDLNSSLLMLPFIATSGTPSGLVASDGGNNSPSVTTVVNSAPIATGSIAQQTPTLSLLNGTGDSANQFEVSAVVVTAPRGWRPAQGFGWLNTVPMTEISAHTNPNYEPNAAMRVVNATVNHIGAVAIGLDYGLGRAGLHAAQGLYDLATHPTAVVRGLGNLGNLATHGGLYLATHSPGEMLSNGRILLGRAVNNYAGGVFQTYRQQGLDAALFKVSADTGEAAANLGSLAVGAEPLMVRSATLLSAARNISTAEAVDALATNAVGKGGETLVSGVASRQISAEISVEAQTLGASDSSSIATVNAAARDGVILTINATPETTIASEVVEANAVARVTGPTVEAVADNTLQTPGFCFVAGTMVHTQHGLVPIEEIGVGEMVLSQPELGGERAYRRVTETVSFEDKAILELTFEISAGALETLRATPNHPFWVQGLGWQAAELLELGHKLQLADDREATIISVVKTQIKERVFNFTVDGHHTYYVGNNGVWVHNTNCAIVPVNAAETGAVDYGSLDALGRPTGVRATITQDMIGTGTPASPSIIPPGWSGNGTLFNEARGHLLGAQLGGSGDVAENLVTLQQNPANSPFMRSFEYQVRGAVEGGETVQYSSTPLYNGTNLVPRGITLSARGSGGYSLDVTVLNPPGY